MPLAPGWQWLGSGFLEAIFENTATEGHSSSGWGGWGGVWRVNVAQPIACLIRVHGIVPGTHGYHNWPPQLSAIL